MLEVYRTNDTVMLSWLEALLRSEGIEPFILDSHTSVLEGSIGAIPRRLMVAREYESRAKDILRAAGVEYDPRNN